MAHLYDPLHPAVLSLLSGVIRTAQQHDKPVAVCGEMAGEVRLTRLLLGLGLVNFSMHPAHLLEVKQRVLTSDVAQVRALVDRMRRSDDPGRVAALLDKLND
mgnify:CR=1 FL=1